MIDRVYKVHAVLILRPTDNLNKLLQSPCDIVGIWELLIYSNGDLLGLKKTQSFISPHSGVSCIAIFVSAIKQIDIVSQSPPGRGSLPIKYRVRHEVQKVQPRFELICNIVIWIPLNVVVPSFFEHLDQNFDSL